jgi:hypothetical protein
MLKIAVLNNATLSYDEFNRAKSAVATQVKRDFAPTWGSNANLYVPVEPNPTGRLVRGYVPPPPKGWTVSLYDSREQAEADGFEPEVRGPNVAIYLDELANAGLNWTVSFSAVVLEMLADSFVNVLMETVDGILGLDVCSPVSTDACSYILSEVSVSDFVLPAWYSGAAGPYSFKSNVAEPLALADGGYCWAWNGAWQLRGDGSGRAQFSDRNRA